MGLLTEVVVAVGRDQIAGTPNHVDVRYGDATSGFPEYYLAAGAANSVLIPVDQVAVNMVARIAVSAGAPDQPDTGTVYSASFDTYTPPQTRVTGIAPSAGGTVSWVWPAVSAKPDPNGPDPLDLPETPVRYQPMVSGGQAMVPAGAVTTGTRAVRRDTGGPHRLGVMTVNAWAPVPDGYEAHYTAADLVDTTAAFNAPSIAIYGSEVTVLGQVRTSIYACNTAGACGPTDNGTAAGRTVRIDARKNSTSPWGIATITSTDSRGIYRATLGTPGTRQLRAVVLPRDPGSDYHRGATSRTITTVARTRLYSARFLDPTVSYGQPAVAFVAIAPAGSARALLQRRGADGVYRGVAYVQLSSGRGTFRMTAAPRGTTYYRYVVLASTYNGHYIAGVTSGAFPLTVS